MAIHMQMPINIVAILPIFFDNLLNAIAPKMATIWMSKMVSNSLGSSSGFGKISFLL